VLRGGAVLASAAVALAAAGCLGAPSRIDHGALVAKLGPVEARRTLELRILRDPSDLAARLALAAVCEEAGRPTAAIEQLEAVQTIGGPIGTRWRDEDRARLGRLVAARGRARLSRASPSALADLERGRQLGAAVADRELALARRARAIARLRHVDAKERAAGHRLLRELIGTPAAEPAWTPWATEPRPGPRRGAYGAWLWSIGARRAAWEELDAWHGITAAPRDPVLQAAYLVARAWWFPHDAPPPPPEDLVGPERCRFPAARCEAGAVLAAEPGARAALAAASGPRVTDAPGAAAWLAVTLGQALRGEARWGAAFAARVDAAAIPTPALPPGARAAFAHLTGRDPRGLDDGGGASGDLLAAAGRALGGAPAGQVRAALGPLADTDEGRALLRLAEPPDASASPPAHAAAVAAYARARVPSGPAAAALRRIVEAYARDPVIADRLAADAIAAAADAAAAHAALGALFEALADPARARASWQAAVAASPEPVFVRGLAEAAARARDPDAALIHATTAAAASGDPAVVWTAIARALDGAGSHVHAIEAARSAIDLAGADALAGALDAAIAASRALGRTAQADALAARRAAAAPPPERPRDGDPTDAAAALASHRAGPTEATAARLWLASRWNPRDVGSRAALRAALGPGDPRRRAIELELAALAADPDPERGRAAVAALR
jgi:hypothetical protein